MTLRLLLFVWIAGWMAAGFLWAPVVPVLEETTRVLYLHIPCAWITVVALAWSTLHSGIYLKTRRLEHDDTAAGAAELGLVFCIGATVSGALWAKTMWGSYWNWDPRETSIFFLLLVYGAYLALRSAVDEEHKRARLSAVYSLVASVSVPFLIFIVPRLYSTLHPDPILNERGKVDMDPRITLCFVMMLVGFTFLFYWLLSVRVRLARAERRLLDAASAA
jgi:heme exporter protein C